MTKQLDRAQGCTPPARSHEAVARVVIAVYAVAAFISVFVLLSRGGRRPGGSSFLEDLFGSLNVPLASTPLSVIVLWIIWGALARRKRIALIAVIVLQISGGLLSLAALVSLLQHGRGQEGAPGPLALFTVVQSISGVVLGIVMPFVLYRCRAAFPAKIRSRLWMRAVAITLTGFVVALGLSAFLLTLTQVPGLNDSELFAAALKRALGLEVARLPREAVRTVYAISQLTSMLLAGSICAGLYVLLRPSSRSEAEDPSAEERLREQMLHMDRPDSLSYFATRRDKRIFTSSDGKASLAYRIIGPVCLVAADPVGDRASWPALAREWMSTCRAYGWVPAVIGASEEAARAYLETGLSVFALGDEAILKPDSFTLNTEAMTSVRQAVGRARRAGLDVGIHRMGDLPADQRETLAATVEDWRTERERGFSMALGRFNDPADQDTVVVLAHTADGELHGLLSFVPWGTRGLSLDLMLRRPGAPNGTTELMVAELMAFGRAQGVSKVSLNFAVFRAIFADGERLGAGLATRVNTGLLGVLNRFTQVESLYRANAKFHPEWSPRYFLFDGIFSLPRAAVAAGVAEGFLPELPWARPARRAPLCQEALDRLRGQSLMLRRPRVDEVTHVPSSHTRLRLAQATRLMREGMPPFPLGAQETIALHDLTQADWTSGAPLSVYGRAASVRRHGGVIFVDLVDSGARLQVVAERGSSQDFTALRVGLGTGDLILVRGVPGASRNGTPSLILSSWSMAAKAFHPIPFQGMTDPEARLRRRSTELLTNPDQVARLRLRSRAVHALREVLIGEGFIEVETPMLNTVHGGASARPFRTFINAYSMDLTLRIAPELQLKRLLVGGLGPVFEIGRNFRNEGADATHNPEFTALEAYQPFGDYTTMRLLTEKLIKRAAFDAHGAVALPLRQEDGTTALTDVSEPWAVVSVVDAVSEAVGVPVGLDTEIEVLLDLCRRHEVDYRPDMGPGALIEELYGEIVEPATIRPTFYVDFPVETSPLAGPHRTKAGFAERWDLVANGMEIGTAYSELTDPVEQRRRLTEQSLKAAHGDPEAMAVDEDFLYSLETGMPPAGGLGIGVDRLIMLLTGTNIRDVLTFPFVRPLS
ncbi:bifunctional lysylphosphatidylglycerol synthetase/lysine--tRNA ligase LysX [Falsarthrobacter nasiphocae]|uniref:Lysyl-tRNA synthetase class 2 n=1 Tax=Falsarthrobacter nasiphocae TaxID=189863 RepID=A0AAE3YHP6_9MICC|nr:bifunctional lysylphosphatidylglycerol synthetase/lysine--tRNA ligase LysX [Falsarthrobacter nasiphocae]MDR6892138.1 lysyl-tRNA synthetase class 2 [Falsarthrobacter nasiphocae]